MPFAHCKGETSTSGILRAKQVLEIPVCLEKLAQAVCVQQMSKKLLTVSGLTRPPVSSDRGVRNYATVFKFVGCEASVNLLRPVCLD